MTRAPEAVWQRVQVRWDFFTQVCGQVPNHANLIEAWLRSRAPAARPPDSKTIDTIQAEVLETVLAPDEAAPQELVFQRAEGTLVVRAATVRAHLKDCARVLSAQFIGRQQGERAFSTRIINGVYHDPKEYWLPLRRPDGTPIVAPDGTRDKPVHARGRDGQPLNGLKRLEYLAPPVRLDFTLLVLGGRVQNADLLTLFEYGGVHGYGGERSDGEGRYLAQIIARA